MQIIYLGALSIIIFIISFLIYTIKNQSTVLTNINNCGFKISKPKMKRIGSMKTARFHVYVKDYHRFFVEFPLLFRFYSNHKFRSNIKIGYTIPGDKRLIDIFDEDINFCGRTREYKYLLTDIILGRLEIEISSAVDFGKPIVCFEILENTTCKLNKEYKLEIKF